jgi:anthranilate/para-aminobenzoate synthase component I
VRTRKLDALPEDLSRWAALESPFALALLDGNDGSAAGRWSFLGVDPIETRTASASDPFALFDRLHAAPSDASDDEVLPGLATSAVPRWIGAVAYDLAWWAASALGLRDGPRLPRARTPPAFFHRFDALVAADHVTGSVHALAEDEHALARLEARLAELREGCPAVARIEGLEVEPRTLHARAIEEALVSIADGDVYQINLARRWRATLRGSAHPGRALATAMRDASPVPHGALLEHEGLGLVARTMERFLRWDRRRGLLETRPIKGTIARDASGDDDAKRDALLSDAKERAEHAMIVDLMRNDLGRVAEIGTVEVARAFEVEPYARLSHLVSTVRARSREAVTLREVLEATFPPGSVTGTPKLRAVERIEALERFPRGFYCGAIGHVDRAGGCDLAVAIRTAQVRSDEVTYFAGGGIVDASVVSKEVDETELKARVFLDALDALRTHA